MDLTIKGLPAKIHERLKKIARSHRRGMNAEICHILKDYVGSEERCERMRKSQDELERFVTSLRHMTDSTPLIRQDRRRPQR